MAIFLTADWHLGETRLEIMQRPFNDPYNQSYRLLSEFNALVEPHDEVIVVGDAVSKASNNPEQWLKTIKQFNGRKTLIRGNHDELFTDEELKPYFDLIVPHGEGIYVDAGDLRCFVTHYPTLAKKDSFNITGHIHGAWKYQLNCLNVGVDVHHFKPIPLTKVPWFYEAVCKFYDDDVWAAYQESNAEYYGKRGKKGSYYPPK